MALIRYTHEQLIRISQSPLVKKPDGLPTLEALGGLRLDAQQTSQKQRQQQTQESALNGLQRPSLLQTRHISKISGGQDEIVLGPPKLAFTSARNAKGGDSTQPTPAPRDDDGTTERFGFFRGRDIDRQRDKPATTAIRRTNREEGEGWTTARSRKPHNVAEEDDMRWGRSSERDGAKQEGEGDEYVPRRNGIGRSKIEQSWIRGEKDSAKEPPGPAWRTRERRDDREWIRGGRNEVQNDDEPEWMDAGPKNEKQVHTQEDFQRWKERMKASTMGTEEKESTIAAAKVAELKEAVPSKPATPVALGDSGLDKLFGMWGETKTAEGKKEEPTTVKEGPKPKSSRFAKMFAQDEPKPTMELPVPTSPGAPKSNDADKEGFERILAMLGGGPPGILRPPGQEEKNAGNGIMLGALIDAPKPNVEFPPRQNIPIRHNPLGSREERNAFIDVALNGGRNGADYNGLPPGFNSLNPASPNPGIPGNGRATEPPMATGLPTPDMQSRMGIRPDAQGPIPNRTADMPQREFLLSLMQNTARNAMPPNAPSGRPEPPPNFPGFPDMPPKMPAPPKGMAPPPGFFDNQGFPEGQMHQSDMARKNPQRAPPGFYDDPSIALQRRNTADAQAPRPQQLPTNMGIPQQQPQLPPELQQHWMKGPQQGIPPPQGQPGPGPPPGFNIGGGPGNGPRLPPGFGLPNMPPGVGNPPMGHPGMPRGMPGAPMGMPPPQHAAYFNGPPPPGFPPNMMPQMHPREFPGYGRGGGGNGPHGQFGL